MTQKKKLQNTEKERSIEKEMGLTIKNTELSSVSEDIIEFGIDAFLEDGILRDLPIIGALIGIYKFGKNVQTALFTKRILKFLFELNDTTVKERQEFINEIDSTESFVGRVGERLLMIIEKMDDYDSAHIIGKLFKASVKGKISYQRFLYLSFMVNSTYSAHLIKLRSTLKDGKYYIYKITESERENLIRNGVMLKHDSPKKIRDAIAKQKRFKLENDVASAVSNAYEFKISEEGLEILKYGFDE